MRPRIAAREFGESASGETTPTARARSQDGHGKAMAMAIAKSAAQCKAMPTTPSNATQCRAIKRNHEHRGAKQARLAAARRHAGRRSQVSPNARARGALILG
eukprot:921833-Pyramimonas_sp.AAC.1